MQTSYLKLYNETYDQMERKKMKKKQICISIFVTNLQGNEY